MSGRGKKRKRGASPRPSSPASEGPPIQKLRIKPIPIPELPPETHSSGKKHGKKSKSHESQMPSTSISPDGDDGGLKMKFILSPKRVKVEASPSSDTPEESPQKGTGKGKKKDKLKAKLFFKDQVLTLDGETVTHEEMQSPGKKRKSSATLADLKQSPEEPKSGKKKKKEVKIKEEPVVPPFTKVPKSADRPKAKTIKTESDSGYSDTPTSGKAKKHKAKLQTLIEHPVPSPQPLDMSRDSSHKKKKKDKDKKKKKMFKFKGDRNRFLNVKDSSDEEGDDSLSRSYQDEDSLGGTYDAAEEEKARDMDRFMMPQMPVPDYNLEKQAAASFSTSPKGKAKKEERRERDIQSFRAEDLISQLTAYGSEMETIYPSYMLAPETAADPDDGWIRKKKKKKKLMKDKKKKKKMKMVERDEQGNVKYVVRKTKLSGYMLWCRSYRSTFVSQNPGLDFSTISRRMGALWQTLPTEEKNQWRRREITVNTRVPFSRLDKAEKEKWEAQDKAQAPFRLKTPEKSKNKAKKLAAAAAAAADRKKKSHSKKKPQTPVKITPPKWNPIDCAAYLRLLGESLSGVGGKLKTHKQDNIEVHGSISVLLDSMLCAMGPLLCLTEQLPEINGITKKAKSSMLDNIAYIMPGL